MKVETVRPSAPANFCPLFPQTREAGGEPASEDGDKDGEGAGRFRVSASLVRRWSLAGSQCGSRAGAAGEPDDGDLDVAPDRHDGVVNSFHPSGLLFDLSSRYSFRLVDLMSRE